MTTMSLAFEASAQKVTLSAELISSPRFGGWSISLPTSGPTGRSIFSSPVGMLRFGAFLPATLATVPTMSPIEWLASVRM